MGGSGRAGRGGSVRETGAEAGGGEGVDGADEVADEVADDGADEGRGHDSSKRSPPSNVMGFSRW